MTMYKFSYELYDGVVGTELVNEEDLEATCLKYEGDCDVVWWDYEEV